MAVTTSQPTLAQRSSVRAATVLGVYQRVGTRHQDRAEGNSVALLADLCHLVAAAAEIGQGPHHADPPAAAFALAHDGYEQFLDEWQRDHHTGSADPVLRWRVYAAQPDGSLRLVAGFHGSRFSRAEEAAAYAWAELRLAGDLEIVAAHPFAAVVTRHARSEEAVA